MATKDITSFKFEELDPVVEGAMNELQQTITVEVPHGTDVTALKPTIAHTGVSISPAIGVAQDFSKPSEPVKYTVKAEDGTEKVYSVTVTFAEAPELETFEVAFDISPEEADATVEVEVTLVAETP